MMKYRCLNKEKYSSGIYCLLPLRKEDMLVIKVWRNEQMDILRQKTPLTDEEQVAYYNEKILPLFNQSHPEQILFSYLKGEDLIGYGGLTHIDWTSKRAEVSFLLDTVRTSNHELHQKEFKIFLILIKKIAFEELGLNRLYTEVYDIRPYHVDTLEECGFVFEGRMKQHVVKNGKFLDSLIHGCLREYLGPSCANK